jgi:hypothetical protein
MRILVAEDDAPLAEFLHQRAGTRAIRGDSRS